ncbi:MAG: AAA family ATPase [Schwartzia sp.]|nr:AAA family ATPase [Schwartzia sp. (in: firmicutes)]
MKAFDKVIGYDDIKAELILFADVIKHTEKYLKLGAAVPSGLLLYGEPGLGKTLMANCFIAEAGCKAFTLRKEKPNREFINQIKETFEKAKKEAPSIVFLDDMDKFANEDDDHPNAEEYVTVQACIDKCKGHGVFVLATVNDWHCLPNSLLRAGRFDKVIEIGAPSGKDVERIIAYFLSQKQIIGNIDTEELARLMDGRSCAELETVINEAGIYAGFADKEKIDQEDIVKANLRMMFDAPECMNPVNNVDTKNAALHEAGHAVVAEVLNPGSVTLMSVCRRVDSTEGFTKFCRPEGYPSSKELQEHAIISSLGGKAAIEVVYGTADMGCNSDMHEIFDKVAVFVDDNCTLGFETFERCVSSEYLLERKDRLIASEVARYYQIAKRILIENRAFLDAVTEALIDHKTITFREMQTIRERYADKKAQCT